MPDRIYTEKEVVELLERTAELQRQTDGRHSKADGLSLSELEAIAADAGLDPTLLRQAASELDTPEYQATEANLGNSATHIYVEKLLPGTLTDEAWEDIVTELRHRYETSMGQSMLDAGFGSRTQQIGKALEWQHKSASGIETRVILRPKDNGVRMRLSQRVGLASPITEGVMYGGVMSLFVSFITLVSTDAATIAMGTLMATLLMFVPLVYYLDVKWRAKKHRELQDVGKKLASMIPSAEAKQPSVITSTTSKATSTTTPTATSAPTTSEARIDPSLLDAEAPADNDTDGSIRIYQGRNRS